MKYAITPRGIGQPVSARLIEDEWPLAAGETFKVSFDPAGQVLGTDGRSLRQVTQDEQLGDVRAARRAEVTQARDAALRALTVEFEGAVYDADEQSGQRMVGALDLWSRAAEARDPRAPASITWLDHGNTPRTLTLQDLGGLAAATWLAQQAVWEKNHAAKVAIDEAKTADAIEAVRF